MSWDDAQLFLKQLNERDKQAGWVYRLPKQVEWEYACRGGPLVDKLESAFAYYFEKPTNQLLPEQANFDSSGLKRTCKVGSYEANKLGLHDMHGNVQEWCDEEYNPQLLGRQSRVVLGGSWISRREPEGTAWNYHGHSSSHGPSQLGLRLARVSRRQRDCEDRTGGEEATGCCCEANAARSSRWDTQR